MEQKLKNGSHEIQGFNFFLPVLIQRQTVCLLPVLHCLIKKPKSTLLNFSCVLISLHKQTVSVSGVQRYWFAL